ncbi:MAG: hypothetical protein EXX96DRAFT_623544 [Benjaminiella poitrasii]|nr:MAG: hypothetical protein EXX96DRAFT_623544 [Benjaminiella poitrasii]
MFTTCTYTSPPASNNTGNNSNDLISSVMLPTYQNSNIMIVDDGNNAITIMDLQECERVYGLTFEKIQQDDRLNRLGKSSMKILMTHSGESIVYCFDCNLTMLILNCGDQYGFYASLEKLSIMPYRKLSYDGRVDINLASLKKVGFLDAPMGSGKALVTEQYVQNNLKEITHGKYDVIIIDEVIFVQLYLALGAIKTSILSILSKFKTLLQSATKLIMMQHRLPQITLSFYCNTMKLNSEDTICMFKQN